MFLSFWKRRYHFFLSKDQRPEVFFLKISFTKKKNKRAHDTGFDSIFPSGNKSYSSNQGATHLGSLITMPFDRTNDLWIVSRRNESYREGKLLDRVFFFFKPRSIVPRKWSVERWKGENVYERSRFAWRKKTWRTKFEL